MTPVEFLKLSRSECVAWLGRAVLDRQVSALFDAAAREGLADAALDHMVASYRALLDRLHGEPRAFSRAIEAEQAEVWRTLLASKVQP